MYSTSACDPYSKAPSNQDNSQYDEPPDLFEARGMFNLSSWKGECGWLVSPIFVSLIVKNSKKRRTHDWDDDDQREKLIQQEALRVTKVLVSRGHRYFYLLISIRMRSIYIHDREQAMMRQYTLRGSRRTRVWKTSKLAFVKKRGRLVGCVCWVVRLQDYTVRKGWVCWWNNILYFLF